MTEQNETPAKPTSAEVMATVNGFDEIAVAKAFGADITALQHKPFTFLRSLIFILKRREGMKDSEAKHAALSLTLAEVNDYFGDDDAPEGADLDEDDEADPKE